MRESVGYTVGLGRGTWTTGPQTPAASRQGRLGDQDMPLEKTAEALDRMSRAEAIKIALQPN